MSLVIEGPHLQGGELVADRPLYLDPSRSRVLEAGDPDASFVLVGVRGGTIPAEYVKEFHLTVVGGRVVQADAPEGPEPKRKGKKPEQPPAKE